MIRKAILKELKNRSISMRRLSIQSSVRLASISEYLSGKKELSPKNLEKIFKHLHLRVENEDVLKEGEAQKKLDQIKKIIINDK